jgi:hypothetical protein
LLEFGEFPPRENLINEEVTAFINYLDERINKEGSQACQIEVHVQFINLLMTFIFELFRLHFRPSFRWPGNLIWGHAWKTKVLETKAFSAHLRRFFAQTKPLAFGIK